MKYSYISTLILSCTLALTGCSDEALYNDNNHLKPTESIVFAASVSSVDNQRTRSDEEKEYIPYEPLILNSEDGDLPLYLHTYAHSLGHKNKVENSEFPQTRGSQVCNEKNLVDLYGSFGVRADLIDPKTTTLNYIELQKATRVTTDDYPVWTTSKHPRWPGDNDKLSFHAVAPYNHLTPDNHSVRYSENTISFWYEALKGEEGKNQDAEAQIDLMTAVNTMTRNDTKNTGYKVPLTFHHALSAIKFAVRDVVGGTIESISIKNVYTNAYCTYTVDNVNTKSDNPFTWKDHGGKENSSFTQEFNVCVTDYYDERRPSGEDGEKDLSITDQKPAATFMMIPQEIPEEAEIEIIMVQTGLKSHEDEEVPDKRITLTGKIRDNIITQWEAGKEYVYTISTSSDNWTYVFNVTGSIQEEDNEDPKNGNFSDSEPLTENDKYYDGEITINATVTDGAYYKVDSYRYRSNDPSNKEPVKWTATSTDGQNKSSSNSDIQSYITKYLSSIPMTVSPTEWFPEIGLTDQERLSMDYEGKFGDNGSTEVDGKKYNVKFKTQYVATDWEGDWGMRAAEEMGSDNAPVDLSFSNCGGARTTANCYVINRGGWYKFPLVYGNAISGGNTNADSYTFEGGTVNVSLDKGKSWSYPPLKSFTDYQGKPITEPYIRGAKKVKLVWQDAYGIIDNIQLKANEVWFHVARADLQQSNSVIAVCDDNDEIIWSWHIWVNEDMVNDEQELVSGITCEIWDKEDQDAGYGPFELAQRNLGWCDPKFVEYLERTGTLTFTQDGGKTPDKTLKVTQREKVIEFFIGNNTYYQWGRKDPMVGFRYAASTDPGSEHYVKYNFGEIGYGFKDYSNATIADGIKNPSMLLAGTNGNDNTNWIADHDHHYYNLWNNYHNEGDIYLKSQGEYNEVEPATDTPLPTLDYAYSAVKTIYDPSPAGFVVPPQKFFELLTKGQNQHKYIELVNLYGKDNLSDVFNGYRVQKNSYFQYNAYPNRTGTTDDEAKILLTGTGQRWHRAGHTTWPLGGNMNPNHIYLWPNSIAFYDDENGQDSGLTLAIGYEEGKYISTSRMLGRKSMARPVRSVKEYTPKILGR